MRINCPRPPICVATRPGAEAKVILHAVGPKARRKLTWAPATNFGHHVAKTVTVDKHAAGSAMKALSPTNDGSRPSQRQRRAADHASLVAMQRSRC